MSINTQDHYKASISLYKIAEDLGLNSYEFDILKRIVRCRYKGEFEEDLRKTIDVINIYLKEYDRSEDKRLLQISYNRTIRKG